MSYHGSVPPCTVSNARGQVDYSYPSSASSPLRFGACSILPGFLILSPVYSAMPLQSLAKLASERIATEMSAGVIRLRFCCLVMLPASSMLWTTHVGKTTTWEREIVWW